MQIEPQSTPSSINVARVDFIKNKFDALVWEKGYDIIHEQALKCPCVSRNTNQQSSCKNCGGTGYIFVNAIETKIVLSAMNMNTKFQSWSQENLGTASVTALSEDQVSFMDRITVKDGVAIFSESLFLKRFEDSSSTVYYFSTIYNIKELLYIALFINTNQTLQPLIYGIDFTYSENKIVFLTANSYVDPQLEEQDISITVRYKHAPQFHIIDIQRETIQSFVKIGFEGEEKIDLPIHAIARRSHYVLDRQNFTGDRILDNSRRFTYSELNPQD